MLFTWERIKKLLPWLIILVLAVAGFALRQRLSGYWDQFLSFFEEKIEVEEDLTPTEEKYGFGGDSRNPVRDMEDLRIITQEDQEIEIHVEEAVTDLNRQKGLMYRTDLCDDCGMVFYFESEMISGFWMKNCKISLDVFFIGEDGEIVDIKERFLPCASEPCPHYLPKESYFYALEMAGGWAEDNGVKVGDKIEGL